MSRFTFALVLISCLWSLGGGGLQFSAHAEPSSWTAAERTPLADTLLLDQYPEAYAAYSLRKLRSDYSGPAIRVRRSTDGAKQDFGFGSDDKLDVSAVEDWLSGADGYVTTWYSQVQGEPDLVQTDPSRQPRIAEAGTVLTDSDGRMAIKFDRVRNTYLSLENGLSSGVSIHESLIYGVGEKLKGQDTQGIISLAAPGDWSHTGFSFRGNNNGGFTERDGVSEQSWPSLRNPGFWAFNYDGTSEEIYSNRSQVASCTERRKDFGSLRGIPIIERSGRKAPSHPVST